MKYFIIVADGAADYPVPELGGKTPFQVAFTPNLHYISSKGRLGVYKTVPDGMHPGSDVANMSIAGYDPRKYYTGRGPLEAAVLGIEFNDRVIFRCNLITVSGEILEDYSAGHITRGEAAQLIEALNKWTPFGKFYLGLDYRNLFVLEECDDKLLNTPPHDIVGRKFTSYLLGPPSNEWARKLNQLMLDSREILENHPVNIRRRKEGKRPANMIWLWGQGRKPNMEPLKQKYGITGAMISAVYLVKGIGVLTGMWVPEVPGATGYYDSDLVRKAECGIKSIKEKGLDLAYIHIEATDEAGHVGNAEMKVKMLERIDREIIGKILDEVPEASIAFLPDHPTPIPVRTHTAEPVPVVIYRPGTTGDGLLFDEFTCKKGSLGFLEGEQFMRKFLST
jgi:2,3-bisphosphoglycerate-independent phosphoglycerate mutase